MLSQQSLDEALAPARTGLRWALALTLAVALAALAFAGPAAAAAAAIGGGLAVVGGLSLAHGAAAAFAGGRDARGVRNRTLLSALLRYPALAALLALALVVLDLPAAWLAAGLVAWPVSLIASALHAASAGPAPSRG